MSTLEMLREEGFKEGFKEGIEEGTEEGIQLFFAVNKLHKQKKTPEVISKELNEDLKMVKRIIKAL